MNLYSRCFIQTAVPHQLELDELDELDDALDADALLFDTETVSPENVVGVWYDAVTLLDAEVLVPFEVLAGVSEAVVTATVVTVVGETAEMVLAYG